MKVYTKKIKNDVRILRKNGFSLNELYEKFNIPKTTLRGWIKDIVLTDIQQEKFKTRILEGLQKGRIRVQKLAREKKEQQIEKFKTRGIKEFKKISKRELFIAGVALYWAEGFKNKHEHRLGFCNSDPAMVKFYIHWLEVCLGIKKEDLVVRLSLNKSYENKFENIQNFWIEYLDISKDQFTKPFYQQSIWKKQFNTDTYKGVLRIHVKNSLNGLFQMRGWIEGLKMVK